MADKDYGAILDPAELFRLVGKLVQDGRPIGFDIETGYDGPDREGWSLHPETAFVVGFSFTNSLTWARYVPLRHDLGPNMDPVEAAIALWLLLQTGLGVAHNIKFEIKHLRQFFVEQLGDHPIYGPAVRETDGYFPFRSDTQVEAFVRARHEMVGLKPLTLLTFGHEMATLSSLFPDMTKKAQKSMRFNVLELTAKVIAYACEDSLWCLALHLDWYDSVKNNFIYKIDMEVIRVCLPEMERTGVMYDWAMMREGSEEGAVFLEKMRQEISADLSEMTGEVVNINLNAPAQIGSVLYDKLGMKTTRYTASTRNTAEKKMSTDAIAMSGLAKQYPVVKRILQWKELKKLLSTYLDKYEVNFNYAPDGMTHPDHLSCAVGSGRFAVASPPYQQSPKKYFYELKSGAQFKFNFRKTIRAPRDHYIIGFDLSQAELRAIAGEAQELGLLKAFAEGIDVHCQTAALMLRVPVEQVIAEHAAGDSSKRDIGKTLNFAISYGMEAKGLADRLNISQEEAEDLMRMYFDAFPALRVWMDRQVEYGKQHGYVMSRFGRRIPIWEFKSDKRWIYQKGERLCINAPIQGAATGDYMRIAMVRAVKALKRAGLEHKVRLCMNIHDALEFYCHREIEPQQVIDILQKEVIFPVGNWPAMKADWHFGMKWGEMRDLIVDEETGKVTVKPKGEALPDVQTTPALDDPDAPDDLPDLPTVNPELLRQALGSVEDMPSIEDIPTVEDLPDRSEAIEWPEADPSTAPRRVVVELTDMPEERAFQKFLSLMRTRPGRNTVVLKTPEGEFDVEGLATALSPSNSAEISLLFNGARVTYAPDDVQPATVLSGLEL